MYSFLTDESLSIVTGAFLAMVTVVMPICIVIFTIYFVIHKIVRIIQWFANGGISNEDKRWIENEIASGRAWRE